MHDSERFSETMEAGRLPDVSIDVQVVAANAVRFRLGCGEDDGWQTV